MNLRTASYAVALCINYFLIDCCYHISVQNHVT